MAMTSAAIPSYRKRPERDELDEHNVNVTKRPRVEVEDVLSYDELDLDGFEFEEEQEPSSTSRRQLSPPPRPSSHSTVMDEPEEYVVRYRRVLRHIPLDIPFVAIACSDGSRVYLRVFPEKDFGDDNSVSKSKNCKNPLGSLLGVNFQDIKKEAKELKEKFRNALLNMEDEARSISASNVATGSNGNSVQDDLWVEKYKPRAYVELLSEETVNRTLLHWLKLWDKTVFGNDYLAKVKVTKQKFAALEAKEKDKNQWKPQSQTALVDDGAYDEMGRPKQQVVILCGPPGLGKTTAAHVIAKHAGYNVREMNASDDRSIDIFRKVLDDTTESRSEVFQNGKPNCLIIDEIDGAPLATVNVLTDLIAGKATESGKKKAKKFLRRPVVCICNDLYSPSLKTLKKMSLVLHFQPVAVNSLVDRLQQISLKEHLNLDNGTMMSLCEKSECDVRSCLSTMQFMKRKQCTAKDALFSQIGVKDKSKGLFAVWSDIFTLPEGKKYYHNVDTTRPEYRFTNVLKVTQSYGDYEKLQNGVFENYLKVKFRDSYMQSILEGLSWLSWFEDIRCQIERTQNYSMYGILPMYFVMVHFLYSSRKWLKIQYPNTEISARSNKFSSILQSQLADIGPTVGRYINSRVLTVDILPQLVKIIQPASIRPVPMQLWSPAERQTLKNVTEIMLAYNLFYTQEKSAEGVYAFAMEPDVEQLCTFPTMDSTLTRKFPYSIKQLIARELDTERLRRNDSGNPGEVFAKPVDKSGRKAPTPTNSAASTPKPSASNQPTVSPVLKDFFGRPIVLSAKALKEKEDEERYYREYSIYFKYKEGHNLAVRRPLKMMDLV